MYSTADMRLEAQEALERVWFVKLLEVTQYTDRVLLLRLHIRSGLFVQAFLSEVSGSLYFALIEGDRRIYGIDREAGEWHVHPYEAPDTHEMLCEGLEPKPLLTALARIEQIFLKHEVL